MPHSVSKLLKDVELSCEEIMEFTKGKDYEKFRESRLLQLAVEREFEIIGEALHRLEKIDSQGLESNIPEYHKIIGFRNILAHGYDVIDLEAMWDFVKNRVPELLEKVRHY